MGLNLQLCTLSFYTVSVLLNVKNMSLPVRGYIRIYLSRTPKYNKV